MTERLNGKMKVVQRDGPYLIGDETKARINEMARAADGTELNSSTTSSASGLVDYFKERTIKLLLSLVHKVAVKYNENIPSTEVHVMFVKPPYMTGNLIRRREMLICKNGSISKTAECQRILQGVSATDRFWALCENESNLCYFMLTKRK